MITILASFNFVIFTLITQINNYVKKSNCFGIIICSKL